MSPMVTESPTDTMNSTMPAARPPRAMLIRSIGWTSRRARRAPEKSRRPWAGCGRRLLRRGSGGPALLAAPTDLELLALVLHGLGRADRLLIEAPVLHGQLAQILVHDHVARHRVDHDRTARAVGVSPALERRHRLVGIDPAIERAHDVRDRGAQ